MRSLLRLCHEYGDFAMGGLRKIEHWLADQLDTRIGDNDDALTSKIVML